MACTFFFKSLLQDCFILQQRVGKDRGNPGLPELDLYPHPFKTPILIKGMGLQLVGVQVEWGYWGKGYPQS